MPTFIVSRAAPLAEGDQDKLEAAVRVLGWNCDYLTDSRRKSLNPPPAWSEGEIDRASGASDPRDRHEMGG